MFLSRTMRILIGLSKTPFSLHRRIGFCRDLERQLAVHGYSVDVIRAPFPASGSGNLPAEILAALLVAIPGTEAENIFIALDEISALVPHRRKVLWLDRPLSLTREILGRGIGATIDARAIFASTATLSLELFQSSGLVAPVLYPPVDIPHDTSGKSTARSSWAKKHDDRPTFVAEIGDPASDRLGLLVEAWREALAPSLLRLVGDRARVERLNGELLRPFLEASSIEWWPPHALEEAIRRSDALVAAGTASFEPTPVLRALASGRAVITTQDSGVPAELVRDGIEGFVVAPRPGELARALSKIASDPSLCRRIGEMAHSYYLETVPRWSNAIDTLLSAASSDQALGRSSW